MLTLQGGLICYWVTHRCTHWCSLFANCLCSLCSSWCTSAREKPPVALERGRGCCVWGSNGAKAIWAERHWGLWSKGAELSSVEQGGSQEGSGQTPLWYDEDALIPASPLLLNIRKPSYGGIFPETPCNIQLNVLFFSSCPTCLYLSIHEPVRAAVHAGTAAGGLVAVWRSDRRRGVGWVWAWRRRLRRVCR